MLAPLVVVLSLVVVVLVVSVTFLALVVVAFFAVFIRFLFPSLGFAAFCAAC